MKRKPLPYIPKWEGPVERVAMKFSACFAQQTSPLYEMEDLVHEAYFTYRRVRKKYLGKAKNEGWFVALFKTSLERDFWKLSNALYEQNWKTDPIDVIVYDPPSGDADLGYMLAAFEQAPREVKEALNLVLRDQHAQRAVPEKGAYTNSEICSRLELSGKYNLVSMIRANLN